MPSHNQLTIVGNLGGDPEMQYTPTGSAVTHFSVAVNESYTTRDGEKREDTQWFRVNAWNKLAETCNEYLSRGKMVLVSGPVKLSQWDGADGQTRSRMEIRATTVTFLSPRDGGAGGASEYQEGSPFDEDSLPF